LHAICDEACRPIRFLLTEGQIHDIRGAEMMLGDMPKAKVMLADKGYDSDGYRAKLRDMGIDSCIPPRKNKKNQVEYNKALYKKRHKVENMFGKLKDWRRIHTRYDRCAHAFYSAICIAAIVIFYIN
jgi:putative transposase